MTLETLVPSKIWTIAHPLHVAGMNMGTRTTIIALPSGKIAIHSPGPLTEEHVAAIDTLGEVGYIIAPSLMHHLFLRKAAAQWPNARVMIPRGLAKKIGEVQGAEVMDPEGNLEDELFWVQAQGMPMVREHVFFHRSAKALIVTDLVFNFYDHPQWWLRVGMRLNKAYGGVAVSRLLRSVIKDPDQLRTSLETILARDWDALGLCHGHPMPEGGYAAFKEAFRFILERNPSQASTA